MEETHTVGYRLAGSSAGLVVAAVVGTASAAGVVHAVAVARSPHVEGGMKDRYPGVDAGTFASLEDPAWDHTGVADNIHT